MEVLYQCIECGLSGHSDGGSIGSGFGAGFQGWDIHGPKTVGDSGCCVNDFVVAFTSGGMFVKFDGESIVAEGADRYEQVIVEARQNVSLGGRRWEIWNGEIS